MALITPPPRGKRNERKVRPQKQPKNVARAANVMLDETIELMSADVAQFEMMLGNMSVSQADAKLRELKDKWNRIYKQKGDEFANRWVGAIDINQKTKFEADLARSLGVDFTRILDDDMARLAIEVSNLEVSALIRTIPSEYLEDVSIAVLQNFQQMPLPEGRSLTEQIQHIYGVTKSRANTIARDQTSKINTTLTQARNEEVGISEYIWRTVRDSRVVGTPGGAYPDGNRMHENHYRREGLVYRWDDPPGDGHPGFAINCRCTAEPIIKIDELKYI